MRSGFDNEHNRFTAYGHNMRDARGITGYLYSGEPGLHGTITQPRTLSARL
jgi:hypothetical protein